MNTWHKPKGTYVAAAMLCLTVVVQPSAQQPKEGHIRGQVLDDARASIAGANVFIGRRISSGESVRLATHTDRNGNFELDLAEGGYDILLTSPAFAAAVETVSVLPGKTRKIEFKLKALNCNFPGMNCDTFR